MKKRILIIDDSKVLAKSWKYVFEEKEYVCEYSIDALKAIEKVKEKRYHIIMIDMSMFIGKERKSLPRIVREYQENALIIGTSAYFKEMFNKEELIDCDEFLEKGNLSYKKDIVPLFEKYYPIEK